MRLLVVHIFAIFWLALMMVGNKQARQSLSLVLEGPESCVPIGESFALRVTIRNGGVEPVRLVPLFIPSIEYLKFTFEDNHGRRVIVGDLVVDPRIRRRDFILLDPGMFIGQEVEFTTEIEKMTPLYPSGIEIGEGSVSASINLKPFDKSFNWSDGIDPINTTINSGSVDFCVGKPVFNSVLRNRERLRDDEPIRVLEALGYFAAVKDVEASKIIREIIGPPGSWGSRFLDPLAAARALHRQCDESNMPYFEDLLSGRYAEVAKDALRDITSGKCSSK